MRRSLALAVLAASAVLAQDAEGLRLRLEAYFSAADEESKKKALEALDGVAVPRDLVGRGAALRRALPIPAHKPSSRVTEKLPGDLECFFVTPKGYDAKKLGPAVLSLHGRGGNGHEGLVPFAIPDEEWNERKARYEEDARKRFPDGKIRVDIPKPKVPYEDGLVIAPSSPNEELDGKVAEKTVLDALERMNRSFAGDPDRVVLAGISMGGAAACLVCEEHPDRFAGLVAVAGYDPNEVENLRPLQVYLIHGAKDDHVPVAAGREMAARLKECDVAHVYREIPSLGHRWPEPDEGAKLAKWMRERVRVPWPREFSHRFVRGRRCFWVEVPVGCVVSASCKDNEISLTVKDAPSLVLHLGEPLVDLEKEVVVKWNDKEVFKGKLARSWRELLQDLEATGFDLPRAAPARVEVKAP